MVLSAANAAPNPVDESKNNHINIESKVRGKLRILNEVKQPETKLKKGSEQKQYAVESPRLSSSEIRDIATEAFDWLNNILMDSSKFMPLSDLELNDKVKEIEFYKVILSEIKNNAKIINMIDPTVYIDGLYSLLTRVNTKLNGQLTKLNRLIDQRNRENNPDTVNQKVK